MRTAIDSCVLVDLFSGDPRYLQSALAALHEAAAQGSLLVSEVVYAELAPVVPDQTRLDEALDRMGISVTPLGRSAAFHAGLIFYRYRHAGGRRERILADFLVAAHAAEHADRLLTRDRGFYREHFPDLVILDPTQA